MQQRQVTSPLRRIARRREIRVGQQHLMALITRKETVETPASLPALRPFGWQVIQFALVNPALSLECRKLTIAGFRTSCIGQTVRMQDGEYEIIDLYYDPGQAWRILARVRVQEQEVVHAGH